MALRVRFVVPVIASILILGTLTPSFGLVITNTGLAIDGLATDSGIVAFKVSESDQGADLNADSDTSDDVLHVFDSSTLTTTNTGLASIASLQFCRLGISADSGIVVFRVSEGRQGATDLNGDGDTSDNVLHIFDSNTPTSSPTITNTGLAIAGLTTDSGIVAFGVSESRQDATDLNGDGDALDNVLHIANIEEGSGPPSDPGGGEGNSDPPADPGPPVDPPGEGNPPDNPGPPVDPPGLP